MQIRIFYQLLLQFSELYDPSEIILIYRFFYQCRWKKQAFMLVRYVLKLECWFKLVLSWLFAGLKLVGLKLGCSIFFGTCDILFILFFYEYKAENNSVDNKSVW